MTAPFAIGDIVATAKGARFWGEVVSCYPVTAPTPDLAWRCDVRAVDPGFEGTIHVYPAAQLTAIGPASPLRAYGDVYAERRRQVTDEGWTPDHDDRHGDRSLARAAACYALYASGTPEQHARHFWPWAWQWWKPQPRDARRMLVKAGALIIAEIERIDRLMEGQAVGTKADVIIGDEHSESAHAAEFPLRDASNWDPQP